MFVSNLSHLFKGTENKEGGNSHTKRLEFHTNSRNTSSINSRRSTQSNSEKELKEELWRLRVSIAYKMGCIDNLLYA